MMQTSVHDYAQALYDCVNRKPKAARQIVGQLLNQLQTDRRQHWLPLIIKAVAEIEDRQRQRLVVEVISAGPITDNQRQLIKKTVLARRPDLKNVVLNETVEPSHIGGISLSFEDTVIDFTLKTQLEQLESRF